MKRRLDFNFQNEELKRLNIEIHPSGNAKDDDVYELFPEYFENMHSRNIKRPIPDIRSLLAVPPQQRFSEDGGNKLSREQRTGESMPLLVSFRESLADLINKSNDNDEIIETAINIQVNNVHQLDGESMLNQYSTILTVGHHKRLHELYEESSNNSIKNSISTQKEIRKLLTLLKSERQTYAQLLEQFRRENVSHFKTGFSSLGPASKFVNSYSLHVDMHRKRWIGAPSKPCTIYGKCCQKISLRSVVMKSSEEKDYNSSINSLFGQRSTIQSCNIFGPESFNSKTVFKDNNTNLPVIDIKSLESLSFAELKCSRTFPTLSENEILLCEDDRAKSLAAELNADVVITEDALQCLLQMPGKETTRWMLPISRNSLEKGNRHLSAKYVTFIEDPILRSPTPRECLSFGIETAIYEFIANRDVNRSENISENIYSLLEVPKLLSTESFRILVRATNKVIDQNGHPVDLNIQLEYFPQRGREEFSSYTKAGWLLKKIIQPECRLVTALIDPGQMIPIAFEEKSLAHALSKPKGYLGGKGEYFGVSIDYLNVHLKGLVEVIRGFNKIFYKNLGQSERYIACLPSREHCVDATFTVSIHEELQKHEKRHPTINILQEYDESKTVFLDDKNLMKCYNAWQWGEDRIPYTFPIKT